MTEELLRQAMRARADAVEIDPAALSAIRGRIARRRRWWLPFPTGLRGGAMVTLSTGTLAAAAAVVVAVVAGTAQCGPPATPPPPGATSTATPSPSPSTTGTGPRANLAIYYTGSDNRLYREFHSLPVASDDSTAKVRAAVTEMLNGRHAYDPDYYSLWPGHTAVRAVTVNGTSITVDLSGASVDDNPPEIQAAALQQLIWTATAVIPDSTMRLLLDGQPVTKLWNRLPASGDLHRGSWLDVQAMIQVIDPQQNAVVGTTFTVKIDGSAFEATAVMQIKDADGNVVRTQSIQVGSTAVPNRATATVTVTLKPGRYTIEGFVYSAKDGSVTQYDNHDFTVK